MIVTIALITILSGNVQELDTFKAPATTEGIQQALSDCRQVETMLKPCMLKQERDANTTVYTNLKSWYQVAAHHSAK